MCGIVLTEIPVADPLATGQRIDELRVAKGLSRRELSDLLGFSSPASVYKWKDGDNMPSIDNLIILAKIFDTTLDDIVRTKK